MHELPGNVSRLGGTAVYSLCGTSRNGLLLTDSQGKALQACSSVLCHWLSKTVQVKFAPIYRANLESEVVQERFCCCDDMQQSLCYLHIGSLQIVSTVV